MESSLGSKGALAETITRPYKAKLIHHHAPWKTREAIKLATLESASWFNHHRVADSLVYMLPPEGEAN